MIIGVQSVQFWIFAKIYGMREGLISPGPWFSSVIAVIAAARIRAVAGGVLLRGRWVNLLLYCAAGAGVSYHSQLGNFLLNFPVTIPLYR